MMTYTYRLPERVREAATVGQLVQVPLRRSRALGVIVALTDQPPSDLQPDRLRDLSEILDPLPVVTSVQIQLARWIADEYLEPLNQTLRLMLPPGLAARTFIVVDRTVTVPEAELTSDQIALLDALQQSGGRLPLSTLVRRLAGQEPEETVAALADVGLVEAHHAFVPPKPAPPRVQFVRLLADDAAIAAAIPRLGHSSKRASVLLTLSRRCDAPMPLTELCDQVGCTPSVVDALARLGWLRVTKRRTLVVALGSETDHDLARAPRQAAAMDWLLLNGGTAEAGDLRSQAGVSSGILRELERKGLVLRTSEPPLVLLSLPAEQVLDRVVELRGAQEERAVLYALQGATGRVWVGGLYAETGANLGTLHKLAAQGLISLHSEEFERPRPTQPEAPHRLSADQEAVWSVLRAELERQDGGPPSAGLLHGVTGSGKTEIYLHALEATLAAGKRAIVLVPEISLTPQTVQRFEARFPGRVALLHSQLSQGQRYSVWDRVRGGEVDVLIGPRSALLAPMSRLGLVVLDESHDPSYKQSEPIPLPAYHARDVAVALGRLTGATVLFGTATPDLETYYRSRCGTYRLLELTQRIEPRPEPGVEGLAPQGRRPPAGLPPVRVVDLRQELRAGNRSILSRALQTALRSTLEAGEQAILFLNRRGSATFVLCRDCGYVARCPSCEVPLTLHHFVEESLVCHHCNHREAALELCPNCGGRRIRRFGLGTERVEATLRELYPDARLLRWDRDTVTGLDHERYLQTFKEHRADILVGTQMIAKGLDLPLVTLVGVISADTALYLPDFRSGERTFQLLAQVAGRAGRSHRGGQVIVQTYDPDHYAIRAAAKHDYGAFYKQELAYRRQFGYPPFSRLVALRLRDNDRHRAQREAERLGTWLTAEVRRLGLAADLIGPAPCFYSRIQGQYRWQVVLRLSQPSALLGDVALPRGWHVDVDPVSLL